jgi:hypothetical protein
VTEQQLREHNWIDARTTRFQTLFSHLLDWRSRTNQFLIAIRSTSQHHTFIEGDTSFSLRIEILNIMSLSHFYTTFTTRMHHCIAITQSSALHKPRSFNNQDQTLFKGNNNKTLGQRFHLTKVITQGVTLLCTHVQL